MAGSRNEVEIRVTARNETRRGFDSAARDARAAGDKSGQSFMSRFGSWLKPSKMQLISTGIVSGLAALPALTAGLGALAGIALGAKLLIGSKTAQGPLYASWESFSHKLVGTLQQAARPMLAPLRQAFASLGQFAKSLGPVLRQTFGALGQFVMPLTHGFEALVKGVLPGFLALMKAAQPAVSAVASLMGSLGRDLGGMFSAFAPAIKASAGVLHMLGSIINGLLPVVGKLAASLAGALGPVLAGLGRALHALMPALLVVGKVLGELAGAILKSLSGALQAVAALIGALAPGLNVLAGALKQVFTLMENSGVFGILENTLEALAKPLGALVSALVAGLAPILRIILPAVSQVSAALVKMLASGITPLIPPITQLVTILLKFLGQALVPLIPPLLQLDLAMIKILAALLPLLPPLLKLVDIILALALKAIVPATKVIAGFIAYFVPFANGLATIINWITRAIAAGLNWITSFGRIKTGAQSLISSVTGWFSRLPGMILSAVGDLGRLLFTAGQNVIRGLINGITSMAGGVAHAVSSIVQDVRNFLPFSPARKGPLSGSGSPDIAGRKIGQMLAAGMASARGTVAAAAEGLAGSASPRGGGAGGAGGGLVLEFHLPHEAALLSPEFWTAFAQGLRVRGGSPELVSRKVVLA